RIRRQARAGEAEPAAQSLRRHRNQPDGEARRRARARARWPERHCAHRRVRNQERRSDVPETVKAMRKQAHPTLLDIAKIAKVAPMTVSRVINDSGYVSSEVRKRVQRAIDKLEYHPNALARSLKSKRTHVIGILLPAIKNPFSAELAGSIQKVMLEK